MMEAKSNQDRLGLFYGEAYCITNIDVEREDNLRAKNILVLFVHIDYKIGMHTPLVFVSCANSFDAHSRHCSDFQVRFKRYLIMGGRSTLLTIETKEKKRENVQRRLKCVMTLSSSGFPI